MCTRGRTAEPPRTGRARHHWERDTDAQRKAAQDTNRRAEDTDERRSRTVTRRPSTEERPPARPTDVGTAAGFGLWGRFPRTYGWSIVRAAAMKMGELRGSELQNASKPQHAERCRQVVVGGHR